MSSSTEPLALATQSITIRVSRDKPDPQNMGDVTAAKSLKKFLEALTQLDETPDDMYTPNQLDDLRHTVLRHLDSDVADFGMR